jgi:hypothetical protein
MIGLEIIILILINVICFHYLSKCFPDKKSAKALIIVTLTLLPFVLEFVLILITSKQFFTSTLKDGKFSFAGNLQLLHMLYVPTILITTFAILKEKRILITVLSSHFILAVALYFTFIPVASVAQNYYVNNNVFAAIKFENQNLDKVKSLIDETTVNIQNDDGTSPLAMALIYENLEIAHYLVEKGADLNIKKQLIFRNKKGELYLDVYNQPEVQRFLKQYSQ